jgi:hypothetical protein
MEKLTLLEQKILENIVEAFAYSIDDVVMVYKRCDSFDNTIKILKAASACNVDLLHKLAELDY